MQTMMKYAVLLLVLLAGCGGEQTPDAGKRGHVWQEQINTMDKARDVDTLLQDSASAQRQAIDAQAQ
jgi:uncharacterized protein YceK